jgi:hypothetical protein
MYCEVFSYGCEVHFEGVEQVAEENIWTSEGGSNMRLVKTAI